MSGLPHLVFWNTLNYIELYLGFYMLQASAALSFQFVICRDLSNNIFSGAIPILDFTRTNPSLKYMWVFVRLSCSFWSVIGDTNPSPEIRHLLECSDFTNLVCAQTLNFLLISCTHYLVCCCFIFRNLSTNRFTLNYLLPGNYSGTSAIQVLDLSSNDIGGPASNVISMINGLGSELQEL